MPNILEFYLRKDVQKAILRECKDREVAVRFMKGYGKRPDMLMYESEIGEFAKKGATSFHISEERWNDILSLKPGMSKRELDMNRKGWDFLIDIDCKFLDYSKICANLVIETIKAHGVKNIAVKFSGGTGFHIGVPFEAFPDSVHDGTKLKDKFPDGLRLLADYVKNYIKDTLRDQILNISTAKEIADMLNVPVSKVQEGNEFNPYSVIEIDSVLISSRHLFRAPYSMNEKTSLISIPVKNVLDFNPKDAKVENVETSLNFLSRDVEENEAKHFLDSALSSKKSRSMLITKEEIKDFAKKTFEIPKMAVQEELFPPCIKLLLNGIKEDGRKRAVFILINFLTHTGYEINKIQEMLLDWNKRNNEPLRDGYIMSQISWFKKQNQKILPPNCNNESYYLSLGVCKPDHHCKFIKNPVNYVSRRLSLLDKPKKKTKSSKN
jgi:hypothetical protein